MPSDAKKQRDAAKKAQAKQRTKARNTKQVEDDVEGCGSPVRDASPASRENGDSGNASRQNGTSSQSVDAAAELLAKVELENAAARSAAGALTSHPRSMDVKVEGLTVTFYGREIVVDTMLELNMKRRYGFVGLNGCGRCL